MEGSGSLRSSSPDMGRESGSSSNTAEKQFMVLTSEKQIKVCGLFERLYLNHIFMHIWL